MAEGYGNTEACRLVGVALVTGQRWRHGRTVVKAGRVYHYPRVAGGQLPVLSSRYLSGDARVRIADGLLRGESIRSIAAALGRSASTVSREVRRNADREGVYWPFAADAQAAARRCRPRRGKLALDPELRAFVQAGLAERWSPEQIANALRVRFPDDPRRRVVHETIYQALYVQGRGALRRELAGALRTGRARRKPRRRADAPRPGAFVDPMVMISERPAEADDRAVPGHWEGDLIMGAANRSAIGTLVERSTRYVLLVHLPGRHTAEAVRDGLIETVATLPAHLKRSLTWDQGTEMSRHRDFSIATDIPVFFCDPASPWQRGSNENTNGLLRQYFPKGSDLSVHSPEHLAAVAAQLNRRPRKTLNWQTPAERLAQIVIPAEP